MKKWSMSKGSFIINNNSLSNLVLSFEERNAQYNSKKAKKIEKLKIDLEKKFIKFRSKANRNKNNSKSNTLNKISECLQEGTAINDNYNFKSDHSNSKQIISNSSTVSELKSHYCKRKNSENLK